MYEFCSKCLSKVDPSSSKQLWSMVNGARGRSAKNNGIQLSGQPVDIEAFSCYFASVATDHNYGIKVIRSFLDNGHDVVSQDSHTQQSFVLESQVQRRLECIKKSSPGSDVLPYCDFQECSYELTPVVSYRPNSSARHSLPFMSKRVS